MANQKWTDERTEQLKSAVGGETPVSADTVTRAAEFLEVTVASAASKLRKLGYEVASLAKGKKASVFTDEQTARLREILEGNNGAFSAEEVAEQVGGVTAAQVRGKALAMDLASNFRKAEPKVEPKTYSEEEEAKVIELTNGGSSVEAIAEAVGKSMNSVRGKALSLLNKGLITALPKFAESHAKNEDKDVFEGLDVANSTLAELVEKTGKTERGLKTTLTRRALSCKDYNGAAKHEKLAAKKAA